MTTSKCTDTKKLIFIHGDKGGVGKSTFARLLADWLIQNNFSWKGFDTDDTNGQLMRFYDGAITPVIIHEPESIDQILNSLEENYKYYLIDLGARSGSVIEQWLSQTQLLSLGEELNFEIIIFFVMGPSKDSTAILKDLISSLENQVRYVIVRNLDNITKFSIYDSSKTRQCVMNDMGGVEISINQLLPTTFSIVDKHNLRWSDAIQSPSLKLSDKQRIKQFLKSSFEEISKIESLVS